MEELILRATGDREVVKDAFESLELLISESLELKVVIIAVFLIVLVSVWTIYERVNEKGWKSLIPIYRWVAIFRGIGLNPWFSLLMLLPGFNLIMLVVFYVHLTRVFKHSYFMVLGLIFLPLVFIPIFAFSEGKCDHYQPHAKLIDEPAKPENNASTLIHICDQLYRISKKKEKASAERKLMTNALRYQVLKRDGFCCTICGRSQKDGVVLHIDHIKPIAKGGKTVPSNLRVLCADCNLGKGSSYREGECN